MVLPKAETKAFGVCSGGDFVACSPLSVHICLFGFITDPCCLFTIEIEEILVSSAHLFSPFLEGIFRKRRQGSIAAEIRLRADDSEACSEFCSRVASKTARCHPRELTPSTPMSSGASADLQMFEHLAYAKDWKAFAHFAGAQNELDLDDDRELLRVVYFCLIHLVI